MLAYATSGLHNNVQVIGEGYHPKAGEPHAEVFALRAAGKLSGKACKALAQQSCFGHAACHKLAGS